MPLVCLGPGGRRGARCDAARTTDADRASRDPWRIGRGAVIGLALGSATLVHPSSASSRSSTVAIAALRAAARARRRRVRRDPHRRADRAPAARDDGRRCPCRRSPSGSALPVAIGVGLARGPLVDGRATARDGLVRLAEIGRGSSLAVARRSAASRARSPSSLLNLDKRPRGRRRRARPSSSSRAGCC